MSAKRLEIHLAIHVGFGLLLFSLIAGLFTYVYSYQQKLDEAELLQQHLVATVQEQAAVAAFASNMQIAQGVLTGLLAHPYISAVRIESTDGFVAQRGTGTVAVFSNGRAYPLFSPAHPDESIGQLILIQNDQQVNRAAAADAARQTLVLLIQLLVATLITTLALRRKLIKPFTRLTSAMLAISPGSSARLPIEDKDAAAEMATLALSANSFLEATEVALRQERAMRELQETTSAIAHVGGWEIDKTEQSLIWSEETYRIFERDPAHPITLEESLNNFLPDARKEINQALDNIKNNGTPFDLELPALTEHGRAIWVRILGHRNAPQEEKLRLFGAVQDISARKLAEIATRTAEQRTTIVFRTSPIAIAIARASDGCFVEVNDAMLTLLGKPRETIIGYNSIEVGYWDNTAARDVWFSALKQAGQINAYEVSLHDASGNPRTVLMSSSFINFANEPCILNFLHDVTERKRMEQELLDYSQRLEEKVAERTAAMEKTLNTLHQAQDELARSEAKATLSTIIASVSHELNTPIGTSVLIASSLAELATQFKNDFESGQLKRSEFTRFIEGLSQETDLIQRNLQRAAQLLQNFRQVAADQASEQRRNFDLATVTEEIVNTLAPSLKRQPHRIALQIPQGLLFDSYPGPFGQVVINLINNAFLHAFEGMEAGLLSITARSEGENIRILFTDNGQGISPETMEKIFQPFFSTKIGQGGTGLGMSIVSNLVSKTLGGELNVRSTPGNGTTIDVLLPTVAPRLSLQKEAST